MLPWGRRKKGKRDSVSQGLCLRPNIFNIIIKDCNKGYEKLWTKTSTYNTAARHPLVFNHESITVKQI